MNDCDKWLVFGDTISREKKKNDHVFHNCVLTYIINFYDKERIESGKIKIATNIVHTDNCAPQYKCRQNFIQTAKSCGTPRGATIIHKFAQKYRFKGSWDAAGKLVKQAIYRLEMRGDRCANANDCYQRLTKELTRDGNEKKTKKLLEYEENNDKRVLENTTLRTKRTFVGLGTENKDEYEKLVREGNKHIIFTDRQNVMDMNTIAGTQKLYQVQGHNKSLSNNKFVLNTFELQCSCTNCLWNPLDVVSCFYLDDRKWKKVVVCEKNEPDNKEQSLTVNELKDKLRERQLRVSGNKNELIQRLLENNKKDDNAADDTVLTSGHEDDEKSTGDDDENSSSDEDSEED